MWRKTAAFGQCVGAIASCISTTCGQAFRGDPSQVAHKSRSARVVMNHDFVQLAHKKCMISLVMQYSKAFMADDYYLDGEKITIAV